MRESTGRMLLGLLAILTAAGCSSMPEPRILVPSGDISAKQAASLVHAAGSVVDVLTVGGEETYLLLGSVTDGVLAGQVVDPVTAQPIPEQTLRIPLNETAIAYYAEPPSVAKPSRPAAGGQRLAIPAKQSYPELPSAGSTDKSLACTDLDLALSRAEAVRWFARNEGMMGYTPGQVVAHHAITTAIVAGVTVAFVAAAAGGGGGGGNLFAYSGPPVYQEDPTRHLSDQVGFGQLRWAITAADVRVVGLLRLKQEKSCAERSTLADDRSDLQVLQQFDALHGKSAAQALSGASLLHEQTRLLDMLGPRPLRAASLVDCGLFRCENLMSPAETSAAAADLARLVPELADERVQREFAHALWYGEASSVWARAKSQARHENSLGSLFIFDRSLVFASGAAGEAGSETSGPPPVRIPYDAIASVEVGSFGLNRWIAIHGRDGHSHFLAMSNQQGSIDRAQTEAAAQLIQSRLQRPDADLAAIPGAR